MAQSRIDRDVHTLISQYIKLYTARHGTKPVVNKYQVKWGMKDVIEDFGFDTVREVMEWYINLPIAKGHSLKDFYSRFDVLMGRMEEEAKDAAYLAEQHRRTAELRKEYLNGLPGRT